MAKKFTIKKKRLRARAEQRRRRLKTNPQSFGLKETLEQANFPVIESLEAKVKAAQSS